MSLRTSLSLAALLSLSLTSCRNKGGDSGEGTITDGGSTDGGVTDGGTDGGTDSGADGGTDGGADTSPADVDGDGYAADVDCDDGNAAIHPDAEEICDEVDNDCDELVDDEDDSLSDGDTWYLDNDNDEYGQDSETTTACEQPDGYAAVAGDCDDDDEAFHPGAPEDDCTDPNDYNCDGSVGYEDVDGDGWAACEECDDDNIAVNPDAEEVCDEIDNNCDGDIDEGLTTTYYDDGDLDGYGDPDDTIEACELPDGYSANFLDCDDADDDIHPDADEICDGIDNDCDDLVDDDDDSLTGGDTWYADRDSDDYGDPDDTATACEEPLGYVDNDDDCNPTDGDINPDAEEVCDDVDNDCDGLVDDDDTEVGGTSTWYLDGDGDGYAGDGTTADACEAPSGYYAEVTDCDDGDDDVNPAASEICDGIDNDCDDLVDDADDSYTGGTTYYQDADSDGYGDPDSTTEACEVPDGYVDNDDDCDPASGFINPDADEICDDIDNDCDDLIDDDDSSLTDGDTWYIDYDGDEYGDSAYTTTACEQPDGYADNADDCDDLTASTNPGADEYCNDIDDDCDDEIDEEAVDGGEYATDADGDGFGEPGTTDWTCEGATNEWDCDDTDATEPIYVDQTSGDVSGDGSYDTPLSLIQDGIDLSEQCVVVGPGTYTEALDFGGASITVSSTDGAVDTIVDATGLGLPTVSLMAGEDAELDGFTLTGGEGYLEESSESYSCGSACTGYYYYETYCGGGLYLDGSSLVANDLVIDANSLPENSTTTSGYDYTYVYSYGGGVCASAAVLDLSGSTVSSNYAYDGGGIYAFDSSLVTVWQSWVEANTAYDGAGAEVDSSELAYANVLSSWNTAEGSGGAVMSETSAIDLVNVTVGMDDAVTGGGLYLASTSTATVDSSILYGAATGEGVYASSSTLTIQYSNVYGNAAGEYSGVTDPTGSDGNISDDPLFVDITDDGDPENDDWNLGDGSPSIDAGNPDDTMRDVDDSVNDQGAFGGPSGDWAD